MKLGDGAEGIVEALRRTGGVNLSVYDPAFLADALERARARAGVPTPAEFVKRLAEDASDRDAFVASLSVPYSVFFRDPLLFAELECRVLPGLVEESDRAGRSGIRIWSAGCAKGEEPYSVAILLEELANRRGRAIDYRVFATDRDEGTLAAGEADRFEEHQVAKVRMAQLRDWFIPEANGWRVAAALRDRVHFSVHDLLDPRVAHPPAAIYGSFDLILCCNLLYYYNCEIRYELLRRLVAALRPGGVLALGGTERDAADGFPGLRAEGFRPGAFFRREV